MSTFKIYEWTESYCAECETVWIALHRYYMYRGCIKARLLEGIEACPICGKENCQVAVLKRYEWDKLKGIPFLWNEEPV